MVDFHDAQNIMSDNFRYPNLAYFNSALEAGMQSGHGLLSGLTANTCAFAPSMGLNEEVYRSFYFQLLGLTDSVDHPGELNCAFGDENHEDLITGLHEYGTYPVAIAIEGLEDEGDPQWRPEDCAGTLELSGRMGALGRRYVC